MTEEESKKDVSQALRLEDAIAWMILKDFIVMGYPKLDPEAQVRAAYTYAKMIVLVRDE